MTLSILFRVAALKRVQALMQALMSCWGFNIRFSLFSVQDSLDKNFLPNFSYSWAFDDTLTSQYTHNLEGDSGLLTVSAKPEKKFDH